MPQIGFTEKQSSVYHRFNTMRRAYEDANGGGRIYNPDFLSVLMDAWEERQAVYVAMNDLDHEYKVSLQAYEDALRDNLESKKMLDNLEAEKRFVIKSTKYDSMYLQRVLAGSKKPVLTTDQNKALRFNGEYDAVCFLDSNFMEIKKWLIVNLSDPVSLRAYITDAEASDPQLHPVRIKDRDNRYVNNAIVATTNLFLTDDRSGAMVFGSPDKAKEFLRKYGRIIEGWILEPVNENKTK